MGGETEYLISVEIISYSVCSPMRYKGLCQTSSRQPAGHRLVALLIWCQDQLPSHTIKKHVGEYKA